jgi:cytochrome c peroxidase
MSRFGLPQLGLLLLVVAMLAGLLGWRHRLATAPWTASEIELLSSLWLRSLPQLPADPSNQVADLPQAAVLGHHLFFDKRLSVSGSIACASCHQPERRFTDGLPSARALGASARNTPSLVGASYSPWFYWDGRKDSQWSQALSPLEDPAEQGNNRMRLVRLVSTDTAYREYYAAVFGATPDFSDASRFPADAGPLPDPTLRTAWDAMQLADQQLVNQVFANLGKALAAYQRQLQPGPTRFDNYVGTVVQAATAADSLFSADERAGLRLFIGKANCLHCHNGPLFTNNEFHNTGLLPPAGSVPDQGRSRALATLRTDPFVCVGEFSDARPDQCIEYNFMRSGVELLGAMRTPSLRNLGGTAPFMHKGQLATLAAVLSHYNEAPMALIGHNEAVPLALSTSELQQLEAFLLTLDAPPATEPHWLTPPAAE